MFPSAVSPSVVPPPPPPEPSPAPVAPAAAVRAAPPADALGLAALGACVEDARVAALERSDGPPDPATFAPLVARLERAAGKLPTLYRQAVVEPLLASLRELGPGGFARLLAEDPERQGAARLLLDLAQAVLQPAEGYQAKATAALQEVVSDLYDGFLSAEDRRGVKPPDRGVVPPLVRWGSAEAGPYTWPVTDTQAFGVGAAVVSLPAANASRGILAWAALAHETAGHDLLGADDGLRDELAERVRSSLLAGKLPLALADYWADRIDETASDVLGVLNMGPAAAVGLVGYFRALNGAWGGRPALRNVGPEDDPHPADIARAYLAAETVRLLSFEGAGRWADRLVAEADRDVGRIRLGDVAVTAAVAKAAAAAVARAIVSTRLDALEGHALGEIQGWSDRDEAIVASLRSRMRAGAGAGTSASGAGTSASGAYAAHAVAAGVYEAISGASRPEDAMREMIAVLDDMHAHAPAWAPGRAGAGAAAAVA
jgi:hypothetical protein